MELARIDRLYHVMVELMNAPKTKDVMMMMPAYVKDGGVYDFNDRLFGGAGDKPDGLIFAKPERVHNAQAITSALKRDYTKALKEWLDDEADSKESETKKSTKKEKASTDEKPEKKAKKKKPDGASADDEPKFDLVAEVNGLLEVGKVKKAKKLIAEHEDDANYKTLKKVIKKASK